MKFKPRFLSLAASLTAMGLSSLIATTALANEAPVVDIQQQQQDNAPVNTQSEQSSGGAWQVVSAGGNNANGNQAQNNDNSVSARPHQEDNAQFVSNKSERDAPIGSVDQRVSRLEQQVSNYNQMNMPQQITDLQQKIAQLQGQLEVAQHTIKTLNDQQKLYYQDTQQQITELQQQKPAKAPSAASSNSAPKAVAPSDGDSEFAAKTSQASSLLVHKKKVAKTESVKKADATSPKEADGSDTTTVAAAPKDKDIVSGQNLLAKNGTTLSDADLYDKAFHALSDKDFKSAQSGFNDYLSNYPKGRFAVSAHFWLGEIGLMHEKYDAALKQFQTVVTQYPSSNKVSDAKLKIAMIHAATGKMDVAREEFAQIRKTYPGTTAAQLASIRLQQLANATSVSVQ